MANYSAVKVGRKLCSVEGCPHFSNTQGLCKTHYYHKTGQCRPRQQTKLPENDLTAEQRNALVESLLPRLESWAWWGYKRYGCRGLWWLDECRSAVLDGMFTAARLYKPEHGSYSNYARHWVRGKIEHLRRKWDARGMRARPGPAKAGAPNRALVFNERDDEEGLYRLDSEAVAKETGWTESEWHELLAVLSARHRRVIERYYRQGMTYDEIGELEGISRERVRQLHNQALHKLRRTLEAQEQVVEA